MNLYTEEDYRLYRAIRRIADFTFERLAIRDGSSLAGSDKTLWLEDRRNESVNPFYDQMESGLILQMYYSLPGKIHTPWGYWGFTGSGSGPGGGFEPVITDIIAATEARLEREKVINSTGQFGPWYALRKIDDFVLPPAIRRAQKDYIPYEQAKDIWAAMTERYQKDAS